MLGFRLKLNRHAVPDEGWGGRLSLLTGKRVAASVSIAVCHANGQAGPAPAEDHDNYRYRVPRDLAASPTALRRVLIVGSCFAAPFPALIASATPGCPADHVLFNNLGELPEDPPRSVGDYDFQLVQIPLRSVLPDHLYFRTQADPAGWATVFAEARARLAPFLDAAMRWNAAHGLLTFVANFLVPQQNAHGRLLPRYDLANPVHLVERLNQSLHEEVSRHANAHVLDIDEIAAGFGRKYIQDDSLLPLNHAALLGDADVALDAARIAPVPPVSRHYTLREREFMQAVWAELVALFRTVRQIDAVKLVIVDLDDTLWRGVAAEAEDQSGDAVEGWPLGLIEALLFLKRRGVLLAIVSKNDEARVAGFWDTIMQGRLTLSDFAARRIDWSPKAESVAAILAELNLLARSAVFVDDNPAERASVQAAFPDLRVLGADQYYLRRILLWAPETQVAVVTEESARRTEMMQAAGARESDRKRLSRPAFLASLDLRVRLFEIAAPSHKSFPRAFELINKTNQFNTTGKRWTQEEMRAALSAGTILHAFEVEDRFSRYGLVGVIIAAGGRIEQMVMSCRVVGLDVEIAALAEVLRRLRANGAAAVTARLVETDSNLLCRTLFARCGFTAGGHGVWTSEPEIAPSVPAHVALM
jgi:FkbH-like protein